MSPVSDLQLSQTKHSYRDPRTGNRWPGVTLIVGNYADGDKVGRMAGAAAKLTREGRNYRAEWNESAERGRRLHVNIADWAEGRQTNLLLTDAPYLNAFSAFLKAKRPEWLESERAIISSLGYGGRFDLIGYWDGLYWLCDVKSGKPYPRELTLQLAGYASADGMIVYDKKGIAVDVEPMPHIDRWCGIYLAENEQCTLIECPFPINGQTVDQAQKEAVESFRALLTVRQWADTQPK